MKLKIALAQINPTVGALEKNKEKIIKNIEKAKNKDADLVVFPELAIIGYPPKDLLLKEDFIEKNREILMDIAKETEGIAAIVGFVDYAPGSAVREVYDEPLKHYKIGLYNASALMKNGEIIGIQRKTHLPTYDVFDEKRYFEPAEKCQLFRINNLKIGINICEDIWVDNGPTDTQAQMGADLIINISASPFYVGKNKIRNNMILRRAKENKVPIIYVNLVGGQDDLIFDGGSFVYSAQGKLIAHGKRFEEDLLITSLEEKDEVYPIDDPVYEIYNALVLGLRDYVKKNDFSKVVIGLSGGIDSSVTACLAVAALGKKSVVGVSMPSKYSSRESVDDAQQLAKNLDIEFKIIPIKELHHAYMTTLEKEFKDKEEGVTEENIQARIRGNILMALSNKYGYLVLSCGNKSEVSIGYVTLYGDMAGGLAVLSDVLKTMVYRLAGYINRQKEIIPIRILEKKPSAELRENQKDEDDLPPYEVLDPILHAYIEVNKSKEEIISRGFDKYLVEEIVGRVDRNEYKRQQAPIGLKITPRAFGFGRRMPIVNKYR